MPYDTYEDSIAGGRPDELFDYFAPDTGEHWRATSSGEAITYLGHEYLPDEIERGDIELGHDEFKSKLEVKHGRAFALANEFIPHPAESRVQLIAFRGHLGNWIQYWYGELDSVGWDGDGRPTIRLQTRGSHSRSVGRRRKAQRLCDHALYKSGCRVNQESFKVEGTLSNIVGLVLTSSAFSTKSDGWFVGGKIKIGYEIRLIKAHTTNTITISRATNDAAIGNGFAAYAGCGHTPTVCLNKFFNKDNFGGEEFLPSKNPFEGSISYGE